MNFRKLVLENPLHFEFKRGVRRFFGVSRKGTLNTAVLVLCLLFYAALMLTVINFSEFMSPVGILFLQLFLLNFIVPSSLHSTIAGEREKRTWDMLSVAPITNAQIVVGKLIGGVMMIAFITVLLLPAAIISFKGDHDATIGKFMVGQAIVIGFSLFLAGLSVLVSSKAKRAFSAQLTIYGLLILGLLIWPIFASVITEYGSGADSSMLLVLHPYVALERAWYPRMYGDALLSQDLFNGWLQLFFYTALMALMVYITIISLVSGENGEGLRR